MRSKRTAGRVAALVGRRLGEIASRRSQKEVARLAGLSPTFLSMLKHGQSKLPIESAIALADALEVDRALLFRFALEEAQPRAAKMITATFGLATRNEMQILRHPRGFVEH
jgi:transcriptional regulator with XRE-family HTH domain